MKSKSKHKMVIYLAGGFRSRWQDKVKAALPNAEYLDPSLHDIKSPEEYVRWDLDAIQKCDVVLAYLEAANPGGYALALELGYAKALGKLTLLVEEHANDERHHRFSMVRHSVDKVVPTLEDAIQVLKQNDLLKRNLGAALQQPIE